jgi:spore germination protein YaaH
MKRFISRYWFLLPLSLLLFFTACAIYIVWQNTRPLLTPFTTEMTAHFFSKTEPVKKTSPKIVYGFLPYWNLNKVQLHPELTHLAYFSLTVGGDGKIVTRQDKNTEPGYHKLASDDVLSLMSAQHRRGGKFELVLTQMDNDDIAQFLTSPKAQDTLISSIDSLLLAYPIDGINIDFEYTGEVTPGIQNGLTTFMEKLHRHINQKYANIHLSIDTYSGAARSNNIWNLAKLAPNVDHIIVMAYDFHRKSSTVAGPVAPLFSDETIFDSDIMGDIQDYIAQVPKEKIILGVPFYGYEWQTTSRNISSPTYPKSGSVASIERVQALMEKKSELNIEDHWNEIALSPYLSYQKDNQIFTIYYENSRSLSYKLDLVNQLNLGGIAIWALGYEGDSQELWDVIQNKFPQ